MAILTPFTCRRLQKLPQVPNVWEGGRCHSPGDDNNDCVLWVDGHQGCVRSVEMVPADSGYEATVRGLLQAMEQPQGQAEPCRPTRIVVSDRELQFFLRGVLQQLDIDIVHASRLPLVDEIFDTLLSGGDGVGADSDPELQRRALTLWHDAPWYRLSEQELLAIKLPDMEDMGPLYVSVLGMADVDYGLLLYRSLESLRSFRSHVLECDRMSPQELQQIFLTQDCFFVNYSVEQPRQAEPDTYEFGSIHPLEGMRNRLDESETAILALALEGLHHFFQAMPPGSSGLEPLAQEFRIDDPLGDGPALQDDLVPEGAMILLTRLSPDHLEPLRQHPKAVYRPLAGSKSRYQQPWPVVIIQTSRPKAQTMVRKISTMGGLQALCFNPGHNPFSQESYALGLWQMANGELHLFHEYPLSDRQHRSAVEKWERQAQHGCCGVLIASGVTGRSRGKPETKDAIAFFEVPFRTPEELGLEPLVLAYGD